MYDDEFELTFNLSDEDPAPVEMPKAPAEEAEPEKPEPPTPAPDEEPTIVVRDVCRFRRNRFRRKRQTSPKRPLCRKRRSSRNRWRCGVC